MVDPMHVQTVIQQTQNRLASLMQSSSHGNIGAATTSNRDQASTRSCNVRTPAAADGTVGKSVALERLSQQSVHTAAETQKADNENGASSAKPPLETN